MYKVINFFTDLHDNDHPYNVGDDFPRKGVKVSDQRIAELTGNDNKQGKPLIEKAKEPESQKTEAAKKTERGAKASKK